MLLLQVLLLEGEGEGKGNGKALCFPADPDPDPDPDAGAGMSAVSRDFEVLPRCCDVVRLSSASDSFQEKDDSASLPVSVLYLSSVHADLLYRTGQDRTGQDTTGQDVRVIHFCRGTVSWRVYIRLF